MHGAKLDDGYDNVQGYRRTADARQRKQDWNGKIVTIDECAIKC